MSRWIVCYEDKSGDTCRVWTEADNKNDAVRYVKSEYWDIKSIIYIEPMK